MIRSHKPNSSIIVGFAHACSCNLSSDLRHERKNVKYFIITVFGLKTVGRFSEGTEKCHHNGDRPHDLLVEIND